MQGSLEPLTGLLCILMLAGTTLRLVTPLNKGLAAFLRVCRELGSTRWLQILTCWL